MLVIMDVYRVIELAYYYNLVLSLKKQRKEKKTSLKVKPWINRSVK